MAERRGDLEEAPAHSPGPDRCPDASRACFCDKTVSGSRLGQVDQAGQKETTWAPLGQSVPSQDPDCLDSTSTCWLCSPLSSSAQHGPTGGCEAEWGHTGWASELQLQGLMAMASAPSPNLSHGVCHHCSNRRDSQGTLWVLGSEVAFKEWLLDALRVFLAHPSPAWAHRRAPQHPATAFAPRETMR